MVKPKIHNCSSWNESTHSEDKQDKHIARQQQDKEINCGIPCKNTSDIIHYCFVRGKATKVAVHVFNITGGKVDLESTEIICKQRSIAISITAEKRATHWNVWS